MMRALMNWAGPIGIDLGQRPIAAAQWAGHRLPARCSAWGGLQACRHRLVRVASIGAAGPVGPFGAEQAAHLREALEEAGFVGRRVTLAIPESMALTSIMELPCAAVGVPTAQLAQMEMGRLHGCDPSALEMVCWTLPRPARAANTDLVMAIGCRHEPVEGLLAALEQAGLTVMALRHRSAGLLGAAAASLKAVTGMAGLLDVTLEQARLVLLHEGTIVYERLIGEAGGEALASILAPAVGQNEDDLRANLLAGRFVELKGAEVRRASAQAAQDYAARLVEGARLPLAYLANQYPDTPLEKILVTGLATVCPPVLEALGTVLPCPIQALRPADAAEGAAELDGINQPHLTAAIGLGVCHEG